MLSISIQAHISRRFDSGKNFNIFFSLGARTPPRAISLISCQTSSHSKKQEMMQQLATRQEQRLNAREHLAQLAVLCHQTREETTWQALSVELIARAATDPWHAQRRAFVWMHWVAG